MHGQTAPKEILLPTSPTNEVGQQASSSSPFDTYQIALALLSVIATSI